jgi:hypothetical protein
MWMPWKALLVILRIIIPEVIHHQEWIKRIRITKAEDPVQMNASALHGWLRLTCHLDRTYGHGVLLS